MKIFLIALHFYYENARVRNAIILRRPFRVQLLCVPSCSAASA